MDLVFEYAGTARRFPYLLYQEGAERYYKVMLRNRFLYVSHGTRLIDRAGELDIPHVGADRKPIGDFVFDSPAAARAAFERFRAAPEEAMVLVLAGIKP